MYASFGLIRLLHTESTWSEKPLQLSQCGVRLPVNWVNAERDTTSIESMQKAPTFIKISSFCSTQLMSSLTARWLRQCEVSLGVDSVDGEWDFSSTESPLIIKGIPLRLWEVKTFHKIKVILISYLMICRNLYSITESKIFLIFFGQRGYQANMSLLVVKLATVQKRLITLSSLYAGYMYCSVQM